MTQRVDLLASPRRPRTTLRWRLTLAFGGVTFAVGLTLLALSVVLVDRALKDPPVRFPRNVTYFDASTQQLVVLQDTVQRIQDEQRRETKQRLYQQGLLALALLGAGGVAMTYALSGRVLRPLQRITTTAQRLSAEQLDERIDLAGPDDELKELADTFDAMLGRLEASFATQQRFVADASHELRTPLAVMRTEVDVALADPDATVADLRASAIVVRQATERADRLVDSLLLLARSDRLAVDGLPVSDPVDLAELAAAGVRAVRGDINTLGLRVDLGWGHAPVRGDTGLLERLAGNVIENAVRHNVAGGFVQASAGMTDDGRSWLTVANSGAVIAPDDVEALFEPFRRHGQARTARRGAGLGMSIARAVAQAHGGTVEAFARSDGGLVVRVDLPADLSARVSLVEPSA